MPSTLQRLIDALRDELQQHGEVLSLLDAGQHGLTRKTVARAARAAASFQAQAEGLLDARARRERFQQQFGWACQRPDACAPADLLPLVSNELRPLVRALFDENESLHQQIEERARQGHPWLNASTELTARLISATAQPQAAMTGAPARPANIIVLGALSA